MDSVSHVNAKCVTLKDSGLLNGKRNVNWIFLAFVFSRDVNTVITSLYSLISGPLRTASQWFWGWGWGIKAPLRPRCIAQLYNPPAIIPLRRGQRKGPGFWLLLEWGCGHRTMERGKLGPGLAFPQRGPFLFLSYHCPSAFLEFVNNEEICGKLLTRRKACQDDLDLSQLSMKGRFRRIETLLSAPDSKSSPFLSWGS